MAHDRPVTKSTDDAHETCKLLKPSVGIRSDLISLRIHAIGLPISSRLGAVSCDE